MPDQVGGLVEVIDQEVDPDSTVPENIDQRDLVHQQRIRELYIKRLSEDNSARAELTIWTARVVSVWLGSVLIIIVFNSKYIRLSENVLITLLTTTTINVIGLLLIVLRNLFPSKDKK